MSLGESPREKDRARLKSFWVNEKKREGDGMERQRGAGEGYVEEIEKGRGRRKGEERHKILIPKSCLMKSEPMEL